MNEALSFQPDETEPMQTELLDVPGLEYLEAAVGGLIVNHIRLRGELTRRRVLQCVAFCNKEGKLKGLPTNTRATGLWDVALRRIRDENDRQQFPNGLFGPQGFNDFLVGPMIVIIGDEAFLNAL